MKRSEARWPLTRAHRRQMIRELCETSPKGTANGLRSTPLTFAEPFALH